MILLVQRYRCICLAIAAITTTSLSGCGPKSNDEVRELYGVEIQSPPAPLTAAVHVAIDATTDLLNRIGNGSFEQKDENGRPRGWAVSPPGIIVRAQSPSVYPFDGEDYMTLQSVADSYGILAFTLDLNPDDLGKTIVATAQGRSPLWRYMFLTVRYKVDGEYIENLHEWPTCPNDWTENIARETIPTNADPESIQVRILVRNDPGFTFCVDHVRAFVLD